MKLLVGKNKIFSFLFFALFLDAYSIVTIGNRGFTLIYIGFIFLCFLTFIHPNEIFVGVKKNPYALLMLIYMPLNYLIFGNDGFFSLAIGMLCWFTYIVSYRTSTNKAFNRTLNFFQAVMNVMAVYGIYQVIAYKFNLPFSDPWIEGLMVKGYNWGNNISIAGISLRRANAVFREPSYFSQFLALNILIYFSNVLSDYGNAIYRKKAIQWIIVNCVAILLSFSGTGLLMLVIGIFCLLLVNRREDTVRFIKRYMGLILLVILGIFLLLIIPNPLMTYIVGRTSEFNASNVESISGYIRLVLPYQAAVEILNSGNYLFGCGIGNAEKYLKSGISLLSSFMGSDISTTLVAAMQPILPRTLAEEGLIGGVILVFFYIRMWKNGVNESSSYKAVLIGTFLMSFMHGTWSSEVYWLLLGFLNVRLHEDNNNENRYRY